MQLASSQEHKAIVAYSRGTLQHTTTPHQQLGNCACCQAELNLRAWMAVPIQVQLPPLAQVS